MCSSRSTQGIVADEGESRPLLVDGEGVSEVRGGLRGEGSGREDSGSEGGGRDDQVEVGVGGGGEEDDGVVVSFALSKLSLVVVIKLILFSEW